MTRSEAVSRDLLGKVLVRRQGGKLRAARIVEIEAYLGEGDPAAHAACVVRHGTPCCSAPQVHAYVILSTAIILLEHLLFAGWSAGWFGRALEPLIGIEEMAKERTLSLNGSKVCERLTSARTPG